VNLPDEHGCHALANHGLALSPSYEAGAEVPIIVRRILLSGVGVLQAIIEQSRSFPTIMRSQTREGRLLRAEGAPLVDSPVIIVSNHGVHRWWLHCSPSPGHIAPLSTCEHLHLGQNAIPPSNTFTRIYSPVNGEIAN
jgi:hypothetical protein